MCKLHHRGLLCRQGPAVRRMRSAWPADIVPSACAAICNSDTSQAWSTSHKNRVFLDRVGENSWLLTDVLTYEVVKLEHGEWGMEIDDETGRACVFREDEDNDNAFKLVQEIFAKDVFEDAKGRLYISAGASDATPQSLEALRCVHKRAEVTLKLGVTSATATMRVVVFRRARHAGQLVFWYLFDLCKLLNIRGFSTQASKWVWDSMSTWKKALAASFP